MSVKSGSDEAALEEFRRMTSREGVVACPIFMSLAPYIAARHKIPRYSFNNNALRYHYTDATGLLGILTSSRLWATDIQFLNDPSEGKVFPEALFRLMEEKQPAPTALERSIINGVREAFSKPRSTAAGFCVSLCGNGDLLSQWRGYGNFGMGYAVGFEFGLNLPNPQLGFLYDISYGTAHLQELADDLLDIFATTPIKWKDDLFDQWADIIRFISVSFKDESFSEENESRIICNYTKSHHLFTDEAPLKFRARGGDIIPYIPLALNLIKNAGDEPAKLPIKRIVAGPGVDFERNRFSLHRLLEENGYEGVEVVRSSIPFRN